MISKSDIDKKKIRTEERFEHNCMVKSNFFFSHNIVYTVIVSYTFDLSAGNAFSLAKSKILSSSTRLNVLYIYRYRCRRLTEMTRLSRRQNGADTRNLQFISKK